MSNISSVYRCNKCRTIHDKLSYAQECCKSQKCKHNLVIKIEEIVKCEIEIFDQCDMQINIDLKLNIKRKNNKNSYDLIVPIEKYYPLSTGDDWNFRDDIKFIDSIEFGDLCYNIKYNDDDDDYRNPSYLFELIEEKINSKFKIDLIDIFLHEKSKLIISDRNGKTIHGKFKVSQNKIT